MQALDTTIANVALPYMKGSLAASRDQITWVLDLLHRRRGDHDGACGAGWRRVSARRTFIVTCPGGFYPRLYDLRRGPVAGGDSAVSPDPGLFRRRAVGPLSCRLRMLDMYPPHKRGQMMAIWGMGVMLGPILGPTLGGFLTDAYDWRWVFYINVPFGIAAVIALMIFFKDTARDHTLKFDWFGFGALSVGLGSLQLMLDRGTTKGWFSSPEIIIEAIVAGIALYLFLVHMLTAKKPFIPLAIFKDRNFDGGLVLMFVMGLVLLASSALISPYLQDLSGYSGRVANRVADGAAGFGHHVRDDVRRQADHENGPAPVDDGGRVPAGVVDVGDDGLDPQCQHHGHLIGHFHSGPGHGPGIRADESGGLRHPGAPVPHRRRRPDQPDAQYRQRLRGLDHYHRAGVKHPDHSFPAGALCRAL